MTKVVVIDENGEEITDERTEEGWLKTLVAALKSIELDEVDQEIERLIMEGKQVAYYSDTVH